MYEAPEVLAIGEAHELILGIKPFEENFVDSELVAQRSERIDDVDESDD